MDHLEFAEDPQLEHVASSAVTYRIADPAARLCGNHAPTATFHAGSDTEVIRGHRCDRAHKFLPDGLTLARLDFLSPEERIYLSQVQRRTYANMFGLVERFISAKVLELSCDHWLGDQVALEALVRFGDEELKHQALFRRVKALTAEVMPPGYSFRWDPNEVAVAVLGKSSWAVLALTLHIELFTQSHYRKSALRSRVEHFQSPATGVDLIVMGEIGEAFEDSLIRTAFELDRDLGIGHAGSHVQVTRQGSRRDEDDP